MLFIICLKVICGGLTTKYIPGLIILLLHWNSRTILLDSSTFCMDRPSKDHFVCFSPFGVLANF